MEWKMKMENLEKYYYAWLVRSASKLGSVFLLTPPWRTTFPFLDLWNARPEHISLGSLLTFHFSFFPFSAWQISAEPIIQKSARIISVKEDIMQRKNKLFKRLSPPPIGTYSFCRFEFGTLNRFTWAGSRLIILQFRAKINDTLLATKIENLPQTTGKT